MTTPIPNTPLFPDAAEAITKSDTATFSPSAIYVGTGGTVIVRQGNGRPNLTFLNIPSGSVLPLMVTGVMSTSTTGSDFIRLF
jgi:hypothetical protein